jgi:hypothetical protein
MFVCYGCADVRDDSSEHEPAPQQLTPGNPTPPGATMLEADSSLSVEASLERLRVAASQKNQAGLWCDGTTRHILSRANGARLTVHDDWGGENRGIVLASAPSSQATVSEGFLLCRLGSDDVLYSLIAGRFVSAEFGWEGEFNGTLRARASYVDIWERFRIVPDSTPAVRSFTITSRANSRKVATNNGFPFGDTFYGLVRVSADQETSATRYYIE